MKALNSTDPLSVELREARKILLDDPKFCKRKVRCVAHGNELEDRRVLALYTLACGRKFHWTPADWKVITDTLDVCELTIEEWINGLSDAA
jgi:hypothetical protein